MAARETWPAQLLLIYEDVDFPNEIRLEHWNWIEALFIRMINRRTTRNQPRRYPLAQAAEMLADHRVARRRPVMCPQ